MSVKVRYQPSLHSATITFNRPEVKNAMSMEAVAETTDSIAKVAAEKDVRVLVLTGKGSVFCAGADVNEFFDRSDDPGKEIEYIQSMDEIKQAIEQCPIPVVAKLNGPAIGLGAEIALASDLRVATPDASLSFGEINMAIVPPFERISKNLSDTFVRELCFTGRPLSAEEAAEAGVYNRLVEVEALDAAVDELLEQITEKSPHALQRTKEAMKQTEGMSLDESNEYRYLVDYLCFDHENFHESIAAFREGRDPDYT